MDEKEKIYKQYPLLIIRNDVLLPTCVMPVRVNSERSLRLVDAIGESVENIVVCTQISNTDVEPALSDLNPIGTIAVITRVIKLPSGNISVILKSSNDRVRIEAIELTDDYYRADVSLMPQIEIPAEGKQREEYDELCSEINDADVDISELPFETKIDLLRVDNVLERNKILLKVLQEQAKAAEVKREIEHKAKLNIDKSQREYLLQQQMQAIQKELGNNPSEKQVDDLSEKAKHMLWTEEVASVFNKELEKLQRMGSQSSEYAVQLNYLETMLALPWQTYTPDNFDIDAAKVQLDADHFGLDKIKERLLEHLAVLKLKGDLKSPILCLVGPPGVGKTSLGKSIADALGRKYVRMSLGGVHDEAEIRGHRRTYIGAMLGRVIQSIKRCGSSNPVFILDEIDKLYSSPQGDPSSALLEVLDPEQNNAFHDNYLDVDYDLSHVMFIATANTTSSIPRPLLDRMELIEVSGYTCEEKVEIATQHLLPKELKNHGLPEDISIPTEALTTLITNYTLESGVRELDKLLASICRKIALHIAQDNAYRPDFNNPALIEEMLGKPKFFPDKREDNLIPGIVIGLAWTAVGGKILYIEASTGEGQGKVTLTGKLGDVMKESAILAWQYVRSNAEKWNLQDVDFDKQNLHVHVPEGATPKDGPSAGITIATAIVSALTHRPVRPRIAMTGEITLRGLVLPVGGIKEKILAAKRAGIQEIILCEQNRKNIEEIEPHYLQGVQFHFVNSISQVIDIALTTNN